MLTTDKRNSKACPEPVTTGRRFWQVVVIHFLRALVLLAAVASLAAVRYDVPPYVYPIAVVVSLTAIYVTAGQGSHFRPWAVYILGFVLFAHLRTLADETGNPARFQYAIDLEKMLFAGVVPTLWLQDHLYELGKTGALEVYSLATYLTYYPTAHLVALAVWRLNPSRFRLYVAAILATFYLGLTVSYVIPTAPPWLAGQTGDLPHVFRILKDVTDQVSPEAYQRGYEVAGTNDVAAMPSLHMAVTFVIAFIAWRFHPLAGLVALLYAASMGFALVYLGEHYVVDLLAGLLTAAIAWKLADWWWQRRQARASRPAAAQVGRPLFPMPPASVSDLTGQPDP